MRNERQDRMGWLEICTLFKSSCVDEFIIRIIFGIILFQLFMLDLVPLCFVFLLCLVLWISCAILSNTINIFSAMAKLMLFENLLLKSTKHQFATIYDLFLNGLQANFAELGLFKFQFN